MQRFRQDLAARVEGTDSLRWSAVAVTVGFVGLMALFVGGDAVTDPGGWVGIGGTALWVLVVLGLSLLALTRPGAAMPVLAVAARCRSCWSCPCVLQLRWRVSSVLARPAGSS